MAAQTHILRYYVFALWHAVAQLVTSRKVVGSIPDRAIDIMLPVALDCNRNEY
jgi:hypothetical protein